MSPEEYMLLTETERNAITIVEVTKRFGSDSSEVPFGFVPPKGSRPPWTAPNWTEVFTNEDNKIPWMNPKPQTINWKRDGF